MNLDRLPLAEAVDLMLAEEQRAAKAVRAKAKTIARLAGWVAKALAEGGRLFYVGAGPSGRLGVLDASEAYDLSRGVKFETYCVPRIRGAMLDELRSMDWVPRLVRSKASKLGEATKTLEAKLGRHPSEQELAEHMQVSVKEFEKMILDAYAVHLISLNKKWYETDSYKDVREIDILEDKKSDDPTRRVNQNDLMRLVTKGLNRNERLIIILYYYEELTMKEIGTTLDLSESRVSQMHSSIVQRLKKQLTRRRPEFGT